MFHAKEGVYFERQPDGGVRVFIRTCGRDDAAVLKDVTLDKDSWASVIASMSYYGEVDGGFYRAAFFHSKEHVEQASRCIDKPKGGDAQ